jgi:hypothetical protein
MPILGFCSPGILNIERLQSCSCACLFGFVKKSWKFSFAGLFLSSLLSLRDLKLVENGRTRKQNMMIKSCVSWCCRGEFMKHSYLAVVSWWHQIWLRRFKFVWNFYESVPHVFTSYGFIIVMHFYRDCIIYRPAHFFF